MSGWDVVSVQGPNVRMLFQGSINVSFNIDDLRRGGSAKVESTNNSDPVEQFIYSTLNSSLLKGDVHLVNSYSC